MGFRFTIFLAVVAFWPSPGDLQHVELSDEAMGSTFSSFITSCVIISRRFARRRPRCATAKACRGLWSGSFGSSSRVGAWPRDSPAFIATVRP